MVFIYSSNQEQLNDDLDDESNDDEFTSLLKISSKQVVFMRPMIFKRFLLVSKSGYDEFSNYELTIVDLSGKDLYRNDQSLVNCRVDACNCHLNRIAIASTDSNSGRHTLKMFDSSSLELVEAMVRQKIFHYNKHSNFTSSSYDYIDVY